MQILFSKKRIIHEGIKLFKTLAKKNLNDLSTKNEKNTLCQYSLKKKNLELFTLK